MYIFSQKYIIIEYIAKNKIGQYKRKDVLDCPFQKACIFLSVGIYFNFKENDTLQYLSNLFLLKPVGSRGYRYLNTIWFVLMIPANLRFCEPTLFTTVKIFYQNYKQNNDI